MNTLITKDNSLAKIQAFLINNMPLNVEVYSEVGSGHSPVAPTRPKHCPMQYGDDGYVDGFNYGHSYPYEDGAISYCSDSMGSSNQTAQTKWHTKDFIPCELNGPTPYVDAEGYLTHSPEEIAKIEEADRAFHKAAVDDYKARVEAATVVFEVRREVGTYRNLREVFEAAEKEAEAKDAIVAQEAAKRRLSQEQAETAAEISALEVALKTKSFPTPSFVGKARTARGADAFKSKSTIAKLNHLKSVAATPERTQPFVELCNEDVAMTLSPRTSFEADILAEAMEVADIHSSIKESESQLLSMCDPPTPKMDVAEAIQVLFDDYSDDSVFLPDNQVLHLLSSPLDQGQLEFSFSPFAPDRQAANSDTSATESYSVSSGCDLSQLEVQDTMINSEVEAERMQTDCQQLSAPNHMQTYCQQTPTLNQTQTSGQQPPTSNQMQTDCQQPPALNQMQTGCQQQPTLYGQPIAKPSTDTDATKKSYAAVLGAAKVEVKPPCAQCLANADSLKSLNIKAFKCRDCIAKCDTVEDLYLKPLTQSFVFVAGPMPDTVTGTNDAAIKCASVQNTATTTVDAEEPDTFKSRVFVNSAYAPNADSRVPDKSLNKEADFEKKFPMICAMLKASDAVTAEGDADKQAKERIPKKTTDQAGQVTINKGFNGKLAYASLNRSHYDGEEFRRVTKQKKLEPITISSDSSCSGDESSLNKWLARHTSCDGNEKQRPRYRLQKVYNKVSQMNLERTNARHKKFFQRARRMNVSDPSVERLFGSFVEQVQAYQRAQYRKIMLEAMRKRAEQLRKTRGQRQSGNRSSHQDQPAQQTSQSHKTPIVICADPGSQVIDTTKYVSILPKPRAQNLCYIANETGPYNNNGRTCPKTKLFVNNERKTATLKCHMSTASEILAQKRPLSRSCSVSSSGIPAKKSKLETTQTVETSAASTTRGCSGSSKLAMTLMLLFVCADPIYCDSVTTTSGSKSLGAKIGDIARSDPSHNSLPSRLFEDPLSGVALLSSLTIIILCLSFLGTLYCLGKKLARQISRITPCLWSPRPCLTCGHELCDHRANINECEECTHNNCVSCLECRYEHPLASISRSGSYDDLISYDVCEELNSHPDDQIVPTQAYENDRTPLVYAEIACNYDSVDLVAPTTDFNLTDTSVVSAEIEKWTPSTSRPAFCRHKRHRSFTIFTILMCFLSICGGAEQEDFCHYVSSVKHSQQYNADAEYTLGLTGVKFGFCYPIDKQNSLVNLFLHKTAVDSVDFSAVVLGYEEALFVNYAVHLINYGESRDNWVHASSHSVSRSVRIDFDAQSRIPKIRFLESLQFTQNQRHQFNCKALFLLRQILFPLEKTQIDCSHAVLGVATPTKINRVTFAPCSHVEPYLDSVKEANSNQLVVLALSSDQSKEYLDMFCVERLPTSVDLSDCTVGIYFYVGSPQELSAFVSPETNISDAIVGNRTTNFNCYDNEDAYTYVSYNKFLFGVVKYVHKMSHYSSLYEVGTRYSWRSFGFNFNLDFQLRLSVTKAALSSPINREWNVCSAGIKTGSHAFKTTAYVIEGNNYTYIQENYSMPIHANISGLSTPKCSGHWHHCTQIEGHWSTESVWGQMSRGHIKPCKNGGKKCYENAHLETLATNANKTALESLLDSNSSWYYTHDCLVVSFVEGVTFCSKFLAVVYKSNYIYAQYFNQSQNDSEVYYTKLPCEEAYSISQTGIIQSAAPTSKVSVVIVLVLALLSVALSQRVMQTSGHVQVEDFHLEAGEYKSNSLISITPSGLFDLISKMQEYAYIKCGDSGLGFSCAVRIALSYALKPFIILCLYVTSAFVALVAVLYCVRNFFISYLARRNAVNEYTMENGNVIYRNAALGKSDFCQHHQTYGHSQTSSKLNELDFTINSPIRLIDGRVFAEVYVEGFVNKQSICTPTNSSLSTCATTTATNHHLL